MDSIINQAYKYVNNTIADMSMLKALGVDVFDGLLSSQVTTNVTRQEKNSSLQDKKQVVHTESVGDDYGNLVGVYYVNYPNIYNTLNRNIGGGTYMLENYDILDEGQNIGQRESIVFEQSNRETPLFFSDSERDSYSLYLDYISNKFGVPTYYDSSVIQESKSGYTIGVKHSYQIGESVNPNSDSTDTLLGKLGTAALSHVVNSNNIRKKTRGFVSITNINYYDKARVDIEESQGLEGLDTAVGFSYSKTTPNFGMIGNYAFTGFSAPSEEYSYTKVIDQYSIFDKYGNLTSPTISLTDSPAYNSIRKQAETSSTTVEMAQFLIDNLNYRGTMKSSETFMTYFGVHSIGISIEDAEAENRYAIAVASLQDGVTSIHTDFHYDEGALDNSYGTVNEGTNRSTYVIGSGLGGVYTKDLVNVTNNAFAKNKYDTIISRFSTQGKRQKGGRGPQIDGYEQFQTAVSKSFGMSHGRNLLKVNYDDKLVAKSVNVEGGNGYNNPYCRAWTYHKQYSRICDTIRPFTTKDENGNVSMNDLSTSQEIAKYRNSLVEMDDKKENVVRIINSPGQELLASQSVRNKVNGLVNITPTTEGDKSVKVKHCMFSIENLAWKDVMRTSTQNLSKEQQGPHGGRIMWFPPYGLTFSESVTPQWNSVSFIGRGENIYTYSNTERSGTLSFIMLIDHPSIINQWREEHSSGDDGVDDISSPEQKILRFFAGCEQLSQFKPEYIEEKTKETEPSPVEEPSPEPKKGKFAFVVYFPNNYSGVDDGGTYTIDYLLNGLGYDIVKSTHNSTYSFYGTSWGDTRTCPYALGMGSGEFSPDPENSLGTSTFTFYKYYSFATRTNFYQETSSASKTYFKDDFEAMFNNTKSRLSEDYSHWLSFIKELCKTKENRKIFINYLTDTAYPLVQLKYDAKNIQNITSYKSFTTFYNAYFINNNCNRVLDVIDSSNLMLIYVPNNSTNVNFYFLFSNETFQNMWTVLKEYKSGEDFDTFLRENVLLENIAKNATRIQTLPKNKLTEVYGGYEIHKEAKGLTPFVSTDSKLSANASHWLIAADNTQLMQDVWAVDYDPSDKASKKNDYPWGYRVDTQYLFDKLTSSGKTDSGQTYNNYTDVASYALNATGYDMSEAKEKFKSVWELTNNQVFSLTDVVMALNGTEDSDGRFYSIENAYNAENVKTIQTLLGYGIKSIRGYGSASGYKKETETDDKTRNKNLASNRISTLSSWFKNELKYYDKDLYGNINNMKVETANTPVATSTYKGKVSSLEQKLDRYAVIEVEYDEEVLWNLQEQQRKYGASGYTNGNISSGGGSGSKTVVVSKLDQIKKGDKGDTVKLLQKALALKSVDGDFGTKTDAEVKTFQKSKSLTVDGIVGPKTWAALANKLPVLKSGDKGYAVNVLQKALGVNQDGTFGTKETLPAVKKFQTEHNLKDDGIVGEKTWYALAYTVVTTGGGDSSSGGSATSGNSISGATLINQLDGDPDAGNSTSTSETNESSEEGKIRTIRYDNEADFFKTLQLTDPFLHNKIKDKIKYFDPAFHSITPEGFNARLNFLHQCTRQGNTYTASDTNRKTATNLAFGRPPVCILRIGDFYYTKIIIDSLNISYENGSGIQWDLNPEGVGIMPMYAKIDLNFKFIGGSDLEGPISRLQNALSFNYYANTRVYDNRSDAIKYNDNAAIPGEDYSITPWLPSMK